MRARTRFPHDPHRDRPVSGRVVSTLAIALLLAFGVTVAPAHAQSVDAHNADAQAIDATVTRLLGDAGYDGAAIATTTIRAIFTAAADAGLPTDALVSRLQEGLAKHVGLDRLAVVLQADAGYLSRARDVVIGVPDGAPIVNDVASWERAATLLRSGWSDDDLMRMTAGCVTRPQAFRPATALCVEVERWGSTGPGAIDRDAALELAVAVAGSAIPVDEIPAIASLLSLARDRRVSPDRAIRMITDGIRDGRSRRQLELLFVR